MRGIKTYGSNAYVSSHIAVVIIESFKPPLLKVGVRKCYPVYPEVKRVQARHSNIDVKLPV